jgi:four helix bundle protein
MRNSVLKTKSYDFALKVIKTCSVLISEKKEYILSKQFLKSGTAPGALIREAEFAQSRADFISKLNIALKESNEADYWISLMRDSSILDYNSSIQLENDNKELIKMLVSSVKIAKCNRRVE